MPLNRFTNVAGVLGLCVEWLLARSEMFSSHLSVRRGRLSLGEMTYGSPRVISFGGQGLVQIGSYCSIAPDVMFHLGGEHRTDWVTTYPPASLGVDAEGHPGSKGSIRVGNDVWIARGARILSGVEIGDGAVVGAYSVVSRSVRPYSIVAGNPAREIRRRFNDEVVEELLASKWWELPVGTVTGLRELWADDIVAFLERIRALT